MKANCAQRHSIFYDIGLEVASVAIITVTDSAEKPFSMTAYGNEDARMDALKSSG